MATSYPSSLDNFINPTPTDSLSSGAVPHAEQHSNLNDALEAVQTVLGILPAGSFLTIKDRIAAYEVLSGLKDVTITSVANATSIASQTGTGTKFVMDTSPTLVTPTLGVATATSINGTTIPTSKTLVATDSTTYVVPSQTGNSGKYLTTDGTTSSWGTVAGYSAPTLGSTSIASGSTVSNVDGLTIN